MPLLLIRQDITRMDVDAIVNAANSELLMGGGVCGAIFRAAGPYELQQACSAIGHCPTGRAVITPGFALKAKYIIHTVGPIWQGGTDGEEEALRSCYTESLRLAASKGVRTIAFPLISSGVYGYPVAAALEVATESIRRWLEREDTEDTTVYLLLLNRTAYLAGTELYNDVLDYLGERGLGGGASDILTEESRGYAQRASMRVPPRPISPIVCESLEADDEDIWGSIPSACYEKSSSCDRMMSPASRRRSLRSHLEELDIHLKDDPRTAGMMDPAGIEGVLDDPADTFSTTVLKLIDASGKKDSEVYNKANMNRRVFSKLRNNPEYQPSRDTAIALCFALRLSLEDASALLARAGYALSPAMRRDRIIEFCLLNEVYNILTVDTLLFDLELPTLSHAG